jgi:hypothetical protein
MSEEMLDSIVDFATALESACVSLKRRIGGACCGDADKGQTWSWNPNAIKWSEAVGQHGKYERSEDVSNLQFKAMLKNLADHGGRINREGFFYWMFKNGSVVGRKSRDAENR